MSDRTLREKEYFDRMVLEHGAHWWGNSTEAGQKRQDLRAEMAVRSAGIDKGKYVLEVGCASGDFTRRFRGLNVRIVAVDISPQLIQLAHARYASPTVRFQVADVEKLDFADETFDAIIGNAILHHLSLGIVLPEFRRVLKPGGRIFFAEPNMANPQVWLGCHIRAIGNWMQLSEDETAFYRWELEKVLTRNSFKNVKVHPFDFLHPGIPALFIGLAVKLGWLLERTLIREIAGSLAVSAEK